MGRRCRSPCRAVTGASSSLADPKTTFEGYLCVKLRGVKRLALLAFVLVGCKHAVAPSLKKAAPAPAPLAAGWTAASDPATGVSIALPPGWRVGVPRTLDVGSLMGGDTTNPNPMDPEIQKMAARMQQEDAEAERKTLATMREKEGIVLHCVDGSRPVPAEEPTRIYIKKIADASLATSADAAVAEKQDTHREAKVETVNLPVGKATRLLSKGQNRIGDQECHVSYIFLDGPDMYVLRFASTNAPDTILSVEKEVAKSFRIAKK